MNEQQPSEEGESIMGLAELIAMRRIPDSHAMPLRLYVGDEKAQMTLSAWEDTYQEMMSKPTGMPKEKWHEERKKQKGEVTKNV